MEETVHAEALKGQVQRAEKAQRVAPLELQCEFFGTEEVVEERLVYRSHPYFEG